ncbi:hypothetical protein [Roseateles violae]|uniref:Uncharacterized protein n=1 Tax=Roseateles violae TaxID=3058042 RepID=A0ABT8DXI6_9BURK|nr:hypothetical protein [Pelomonas sp. PFR6]MDN3921494.1 hypothetical protein [Pelomonas sp. PFR6]
MRVAVLFARKSSVYKTLPGCDVYDEQRDARTYGGGAPVIAHPPCRGWGRLAHVAKIKPGEKELALFGVEQVRRWNGVLEHPANSKLWEVAGLPKPGETDCYGGWTLPILQSWWGHRAPKDTWLYVKGCAPFNIPAMPLALGIPEGRIENMCTAERERTPPALAAWLVDLARRC